MKNSKKILIIGAGIMQIPVIEECKKLGYKTIVTDIDENALGMRMADIALKIDTLDKEATFDVAKKYKINGIVTTSDYPVRTVAYVCKNFKIKGLSESVAKACTNKYLLRKKLSENRITCPMYWKVENLKELSSIEKDILFPVIVKPVDSSASRGVAKVSNCKKLKNAFKSAKIYSRNGAVIIEQFLEGNEYSVESLTQNGKTVVVGITEKTISSGNSYFVEERHIIPANIKPKEKEEIERLIPRVIKAIGLDNCGTQGPVIIEIGARLGGDFITSDLVPLSTGVNMLRNIINISIGKEINSKKKKKKYAGIQFINSDNYDLAKKHLEKIKSRTGFVKSELKEYRKMELKSSLDRLGYYICVANSRKKLLELLDIGF